MMGEINARTLMFNLGPEDAIDSTTSAKIARYTERKQLAYKLTDEGVLLLDGRGKKIHLNNGVVTLRNALGLHALPERKMDDFRPSHHDNVVLNTETPPTTTQTNMLHVRKMALVDPRLLKSLHENTTPQPPVDKILRDLDAEMTSILKSDADVSEKVPLYNQLLLRYNEFASQNLIFPQAGNRTDRSNRCVVMIHRPCLIFVAVTIVIIFAAVVFLLAPAPMDHWCPGGIVVWGDRNYTDNTTTRKVSEVTAVLPLYKE